jgi:hypothetical protein
VSYGPAFNWPPDRALFKWFFGFPLPPALERPLRGCYHRDWTFLTPSLEAMRASELWWVALILVRNLGLAIMRRQHMGLSGGSRA